MKLRLAFAIVLSAVLPCTACASGIAGWQILAAEVIPYSGAVQALAGKDIGYWFLALAAISIGTWTWIVKWLIAQLDKQRDAHAATTTKLIDFMEKDHSDMRSILGRTNELLDQALDDKRKP